MAFEDLRDQVSEKAQAYWGRFQESSLYIQVAEKYNDLNPTAQKLVAAGAMLLVALLTLTIPWSYLSSSQQSITEFEENKQLLRELYKVSRASANLQGAPPAVDPGALVTSAQARLTGMALQAEQIVTVQPVELTGNPPNEPKLPGLPAAVQQRGIEVTLNKINLRQVLKVGEELLNLQPGLKMTGLTISANAADFHYFDVVYRIVSFSLPALPEDAKPAPGAKRASRRSKPADDAPAEESEE